MGIIRRRLLLSDEGGLLPKGQWLSAPQYTAFESWPIYTFMSADGNHAGVITGYNGSNMSMYSYDFNSAVNSEYPVYANRHKYVSDAGNFKISRIGDNLIWANTYSSITNTISSYLQQSIGTTNISTTYNNASYVPILVDDGYLYTMRSTSYRYRTQNLTSFTSQTTYYCPSGSLLYTYGGNGHAFFINTAAKLSQYNMTANSTTQLTCTYLPSASLMFNRYKQGLLYDGNYYFPFSSDSASGILKYDNSTFSVFYDDTETGISSSSVASAGALCLVGNYMAYASFNTNGQLAIKFLDLSNGTEISREIVMTTTYSNNRIYNVTSLALDINTGRGVTGYYIWTPASSAYYDWGILARKTS